MAVTSVEVEVDPDTGHVQLDRYAVVDDVGTVINPIGLKGQIHGGVAPGVRPDPDASRWYGTARAVSS